MEKFVKIFKKSNLLFDEYLSVKEAWEKEKDTSTERVKRFSKTRFIHIYLMFRSFWLNREILPRLLLSAREKGFTVASTLPPFSEDDWNFVEES